MYLLGIRLYRSTRANQKQIYALGFAIYGLSEYNRATGDKEALDYAIRLFKAIEQYSFDPEKNGYMEAFTKDWKLIEDMRITVPII